MYETCSNHVSSFSFDRFITASHRATMVYVKDGRMRVQWQVSIMIGCFYSCGDTRGSWAIDRVAGYAVTFRIESDVVDVIRGAEPERAGMYVCR